MGGQAIAYALLGTAPPLNATSLSDRTNGEPSQFCQVPATLRDGGFTWQLRREKSGASARAPDVFTTAALLLRRRVASRRSLRARRRRDDGLLGEVAGAEQQQQCNHGSEPDADQQIVVGISRLLSV